MRPDAEMTGGVSSGAYIFTTPEYSDWQCQLFGSGPVGISFRPPKGQEPNWFWRQMQYLCFGNKWKWDPQKQAVSD